MGYSKLIFFKTYIKIKEIKKIIDEVQKKSKTEANYGLYFHAQNEMCAGKNKTQKVDIHT